MPIPQHVFDPPFNIIRCSHAVLDVTDRNASRAFYENAIGLHVEDSDSDVVYLRGSEEHQHHSLVLRKAQAAACSRLAFKVGNDADLLVVNANTLDLVHVVARGQIMMRDGKVQVQEHWCAGSDRKI